jgi:hypothetical protein
MKMTGRATWRLVRLLAGEARASDLSSVRPTIERDPFVEDRSQALYHFLMRAGARIACRLGRTRARQTASSGRKSPPPQRMGHLLAAIAVFHDHASGAASRHSADTASWTRTAASPPR